MDAAAIVVCFCIFRAEADGLTKIGDGFLVFAFFVEGDAAIHESVYIFQVMAKGLIVIGDCIIDLTSLVVEVAAIVVGCGLVTASDRKGVFVAADVIANGPQIASDRRTPDIAAAHPLPIFTKSAVFQSSATVTIATVETAQPRTPSISPGPKRLIANYSALEIARKNTLSKT